MVGSSQRSSRRDRVAALYRAYGYVVLRRGRRLLGSESEAEELLQETFAALLVDDRVELDAIEQPAAWLYAAATRRALNQLRDRATRGRLLAERVVPALDWTSQPRGDRIAEMAQLLGALPTDQAEAVVYFVVDQLTHDEIAAQLGCSRRHVGNLLARGLAALRTVAPAREAAL